MEKLKNLEIQFYVNELKNQKNKKDFYIQCYQKKYKNFGFLYKFLLLI